MKELEDNLRKRQTVKSVKNVKEQTELEKAIKRAKYIKDNFDLDDHDKETIGLVIEAASEYNMMIESGILPPSFMPKRFKAETPPDTPIPKPTEEECKTCLEHMGAHIPMSPKSEKRLKVVPIEDKPTEEGSALWQYCNHLHVSYPTPDNKCFYTCTDKDELDKSNCEGCKVLKKQPT